MPVRMRTCLVALVAFAATAAPTAGLASSGIRSAPGDRAGPTGTAWRRFRLPPLVHPTELYGVSVLAPDDAWAVGTYEDNGYHGHVLTLHWDGATWDVVPAVDGQRVKLLSAVDGVTGQDIWAAG